MIDTEIKFNRFNHDYDCFVDSRYVGSRPTYTAGDSLVRQVAADLIADGLAMTAANLDGAQADDDNDPPEEGPCDDIEAPIDRPRAPVLA